MRPMSADWCGGSATFTVDAYPDRSFTGRVLQIRKSPEVMQNVVTYTAVFLHQTPTFCCCPG